MMITDLVAPEAILPALKVNSKKQALQELSARWDERGESDVLDALRDRVLERNYINNLLAGIERELNS